MSNRTSITPYELAEAFTSRMPVWEGDVFTCSCGFSAKNDFDPENGPEVPDTFIVHQMSHLLELVNSTGESVEQEIKDRVSRETDLIAVRQHAIEAASSLFAKANGSLALSPFLASDSIVSIAKRMVTYVTEGTDD